MKTIPVMKWEEFKEQFDYFLQVLKDENLTEETKDAVNKSLQSMIKMWANPIMYLSVDGLEGEVWRG